LAYVAVIEQASPLPTPFKEFVALA
jgi:hypothetical protein